MDGDWEALRWEKVVWSPHPVRMGFALPLNICDGRWFEETFRDSCQCFRLEREERWRATYAIWRLRWRIPKRSSFQMSRERLGFGSPTVGNSC